MSWAVSEVGAKFRAYSPTNQCLRALDGRAGSAEGRALDWTLSAGSCLEAISQPHDFARNVEAPFRSVPMGQPEVDLRKANHACMRAVHG